MSINAKQSLKGNLNVGAGSEVEIYSYYTPSVTQPDTNTMQVDYTPSSEDMPAIDPVQIVLPVGPKGEPGDDGYTPQKGVDYFDGAPGEDGKDGITPHIGENGNWFIGGEDTGIPAAGGNYTLPTASTDILGGVKADPVTDSDTQPVHIDETGKLFITPGSNFVAQPEAPEDKNVLWIDTDDEVGVLSKAAVVVQPGAPEDTNALWIDTDDEGEDIDYYYTPAVTQPDANTIRVEYTPSAETMPAVPAANVTLPAGPQGPKGDTGNNGTTPHIGDNGNWWLGDTDTGARAVEPQYELIERKTIDTDGVKAVVFTHSLSDFLLIIDTLAAEAASNGGIEIYRADNEFAGYCFLGGAIKTNPQRHIMWSAQIAAKTRVEGVTGDFVPGTSNYQGLKAQSVSLKFMDVGVPYAKYSFYTTNPMPIGTTMELWGVRADA